MTGFPKPPPALLALVNPNLHGAACAGKAPLFDAKEKAESYLSADARHEQARALCNVCPVSHACAEALLDLPLGQRHGIWAGVDATLVTTTFQKEEAA